MDESQLSDLAEESAVVRRAVALAGWLADSGPRLLTGREVLRKPDVPAAAAVIGVKAPLTLRSAADVPDLHRAWLLALAAGLVAVTGGKAMARSTALPEQDTEVLSAWLDALRASAAAEYGQRSVPDDILLSFLEVAAEDPADPRVQGWMRRRSACWTLLDAFGAVAAGPVVTPLGRWAMDRLGDSQPVMPENLTAAGMLARLAMFDQAQRRDLAWEWMAERDPEEAVREILRAADSMSPRMRWLAADVAEEAGEEALPVWREALSEPLLAVHARCALIAWDDAPGLTGAEQLWLAVEAAAAGLEERGPDEALCCLWERVPGTTIDDRLAAIRSSGHPAAAEVTVAVADLAASGVPLAIDQAMQLKVQLKYFKPPIWRSVVVPSLATLGDLHQVIQIVFGWDGDHLHAFHVGGRNYSDPSFGLEETGEEEDVRVRDAFRGKIPVGYEYDFGASRAWSAAPRVRPTRSAGVPASKLLPNGRWFPPPASRLRFLSSRTPVAPRPGPARRLLAGRGTGRLAARLILDAFHGIFLHQASLLDAHCHQPLVLRRAPVREQLAFLVPQPGCPPEILLVDGANLSIFFARSVNGICPDAGCRGYERLHFPAQGVQVDVQRAVPSRRRPRPRGSARAGCVFLASVPPGAAGRRVRPVARADVLGRGLEAGRLPLARPKAGAG